MKAQLVPASGMALACQRDSYLKEVSYQHSSFLDYFLYKETVPINGSTEHQYFTV